jgi:hypothetical protein
MSDITWITQGDTLRTYTLKFPPGYWPQQTTSAQRFKRSWVTSLPETIQPLHMWHFIGWDSGDMMELDLEVYATNEEGHDQFPLVLRSPHVHEVWPYDAWEKTDLFMLPGLRWLRIYMSAHVVCGWQGRAHFGLKLIGEPYED